MSGRTAPEAADLVLRILRAVLRNVYIIAVVGNITVARAIRFFVDAVGGTDRVEKKKNVSFVFNAMERKGKQVQKWNFFTRRDGNGLPCLADRMKICRPGCLVVGLKLANG